MPKNSIPKEKFFLFYKGEISRGNALEVIRELKRLPPDATIELDVIIHSYGGVAHSAFQIVRILRERCSTLRIVVPLIAKSAATLLALGSDEIIMGSQSELGPLDTQIEHPDESSYISALDLVGSLEYLSGFAMDFSMKIGKQARTEYHLSRKDSIECGLDCAIAYIMPLVEKLDPISLTKSHRGLRVAEEYGLKLLEEYMFKELPNRSQKARDLAYELVWNYQTHGFVIDYREAKKLGLSVSKYSEYQYNDEAWNFILAMLETKHDFIRLFSEEELKALGEDSNGQG